jgi:azurin
MEPTPPRQPTTHGSGLTPGTYKFLCDVPGHEDAMQGVLYVN